MALPVVAFVASAFVLVQPVISQVPQWKILTPANSGLADSVITAVAADLRGNIWLGSISGTVTEFDGDNWKTYRSTDGLPVAMITAIASDPTDSSIWVGFRARKGIAKLVGTHWMQFGFSSCSGDCDAEVLTIDYSHTKWIGTRSDGFWTFNDSVWSSYSAPPGYTFSTVLSIALDRDRSVWLTESQGDIGKNGYALFHYAGSNWDHITQPSSVFSDSSIKFIQIDRTGKRWLISDSSMLRYDDSVWNKYLVGDSNLKSSPFYVAFDTSGTPWILTRTDSTTWLQTLRGSNWDQFEFPIHPQTVWGISVDLSDNKWIATSDGALEFNENGILTSLRGVEVGSPKTFTLRQNYPNPFNPSTNIRFELPENAHIRLGVYDVLGQQVAILADQFMYAGHHEVGFVGNCLASGIYFYRLQTDKVIAAKKMVLIR